MNAMTVGRLGTRITRITARAGSVAGAVAVAATLSIAPALAQPQVVPFGEPAQISGASGTQDIEYTVGELAPSGNNDGIWYSEVTAKGIRGSSRPVIADFNARAANGSTYWVMKGNQVDGLPNVRIAAGTEISGKLYFDVRKGPPPDSVVYRNASGQDIVVWKGSGGA